MLEAVFTLLAAFHILSLTTAELKDRKGNVIKRVLCNVLYALLKIIQGAMGTIIVVLGIGILQEALRVALMI